MGFERWRVAFSGEECSNRCARFPSLMANRVHFCFGGWSLNLCHHLCLTIRGEPCCQNLEVFWSDYPCGPDCLPFLKHLWSCNIWPWFPALKVRSSMKVYPGKWFMSSWISRSLLEPWQRLNSFMPCVLLRCHQVRTRVRSFSGLVILWWSLVGLVAWFFRRQ